MVTCSASVGSPSPAADPLSSCDLISRRFHGALAEDDLFIFHRSQWKCLAYTFTRVLQLLLPVLQSASPASPSSLAIAVRVLYEAMSEAERCMLDCSASLGRSVNHSWLLDKALMEVTSTDVIDVHLARFLWAFSITAMVADPVWRQADAVPSDVVCLTEALSIIWQGEDANGDLSSCRDFLTTMNCEEHGKSCLLAQFIVRKMLHHMQELDSAPSQDLPAYLWIDSSSHEPNSKAVGDGSNGNIYQTEWLGGLFAIKVFFRTENNLFVQEAAIQARARHPNVLTLVCCTKTTSPLSHSLVMELMQKDLRMLMVNRKDAGISPPFSLGVALDLMLQIAQGMEYLHSIHVMHRDLKSWNVLVKKTSDKPGDKDTDPSFIHLKVCDFGMSKAKLASEMYSSLQVGTPYWRAPEVFAKYHEGDTNTATQRYTKKADVYSFAMVCYEILTGEIPYDGLNVTKCVLKGDRPTLPSNCPRALSCFIESCWNKEPSERPSFREICGILRFLKFCVLLQHEKDASLLHFLSQPFPPGLCASIQGAKSFIQFGGPNPLKIPLEMHCCGMFLQQSFDSNESVQWKPAGQVKAVPRSKAHPKADKSHHSKHQHGVPGNESQLFSLDRMRRLWKKPNRNPAAQILDGILPSQAGEGIDKDLVHSFSVSELELATANYSRIVYRAGGGQPFYHGRLENGREIAVKTPPLPDSGFDAGREMMFASILKHRNIVPFLGKCEARQGTFLVYEFMEHGTLADHLFKKHGLNLNWQQRFQICGQLASVLKYLHEDAYHFPIVHRDVKPGNVMLDSELNACLWECGDVSIILRDDSQHAVADSHGYLSPDLLVTAIDSTAQDVYAFGMTVLNILTGRRLFCDKLLCLLHPWVWQMYKKGRSHWMCTADPRLEGEFSEVEFKRLLLLALACTNRDPNLRPRTEALSGLISGTLQPLPISLPELESGGEIEFHDALLPSPNEKCSG